MLCGYDALAPHCDIAVALWLLQLFLQFTLWLPVMRDSSAVSEESTASVIH